MDNAYQLNNKNLHTLSQGYGYKTNMIANAMGCLGNSFRLGLVRMHRWQSLGGAFLTIKVKSQEVPLQQASYSTGKQKA